MKTILIKLLISFCLIKLSEQKLACKNENGHDIDWYIIFKYPGSADFFYLSSDMSTAAWKKPNFGLDSKNNMVGQTLKQAYAAKASGTFYGFYNDEKFKFGTGGGHLKGVVNFDNKTGYWLVHSVPKFPPPSSYKYPAPQMINGQAFFCVSLASRQLKAIINQLLIMYSLVYDYNFPSIFNDDPDLSSLLDRFVHNQHSIGINNYTIHLKTLAGLPLIHFGKSNEFDNDLYADLISPSLKTSLFTETWMHGEVLKSNCTGQYKVFNVLQLSFNGMKFEDSVDHSKWTISTNLTIPAVCIGDINRVKTQFFRGGGSLCIFKLDVWKAFNSVISKFEKCGAQ